MRFDAQSMGTLAMQMMPWVDKIARGFSVAAILGICWFLSMVVLRSPIIMRVRHANGELVDLAPTVKLIGSAFIIAIAIVQAWFTIALPLLLVAKIYFIELMVSGILGCLIGIASAGRWHQQLTQIQDECEVATSLVFLQGEMTRAQLEAVNERIQRSMEPEEIDLTETVLKSLSPALMLFIQKEKSIVKWSMTGLSIAKSLSKYFWSPKK